MKYYINATAPIGTNVIPLDLSGQPCDSFKLLKTHVTGLFVGDHTSAVYVKHMFLAPIGSCSGFFIAQGHLKRIRVVGP